jgi:imidazolonepropionase
MLLQGTTTAEAKSGYGLETEAELRSLEAIRRADRRHPITLVSTFLGAHEVPLDHRDDRDRYIEIVVKEMIPEVARRGLAEFCDVFCEAGVFTVDESRRILSAGAGAGMKLRLHADELEWTGGAELAAELGARSADHLGFVSDAGMRALAESSCVATVLPVASFYLRLAHFAPARALIDAGTALAIATDVNPGGGHSPSMPFAMAFASFSMGLSLEEALTAATINAAASLDLGDSVGSLEVGKRADLVMLRSGRLLDLLRVGVAAVDTVVKSGLVVVEGGQLAYEPASPWPTRSSNRAKT